jgi:DNA (cytosine-5)-methyltransferase 1
VRHLDLFSGIGGFSLGLERTGGFKTVAFCDNEPKTHLVLKKHWPNVPIFDDVKTLTGDKLGTIDIITGGFPCQDISLAGKGAGLEGERSGLWFEFHRLIKETKPKWVIAENVAALRSRGLDQVLRSLAEIGYDAEWHCIPASAVGAPHRRDRIWIVAYPKLHDGRDGSSTEPQGWDSRMEPWRSGERQSEQSADKDVAYSNSSLATNGRECSSIEKQSNGRGNEQRGSGSDGWKGCVRSSRESSKDDLADPIIRRLERYTRDVEGRGERQEQNGSVTEEGLCSRTDTEGWWETEPNVGRVADGIPNRVDRLKQLGNAIVPQIAELIGRSILAKEQHD